jgi:TPR repeat protein
MKQIAVDKAKLPFVDAVATRPKTKYRRRGALVASALLVLALVGVGGWFSFSSIVKPRMDTQRLEQAISTASTADPEFARRSKNWRGYPPEQMLLLHFSELSSPLPGVADDVRLAGARAAIDIAIRSGSLEARLELGKAYRDGVFGAGDSEAALQEFDRLKESTEIGVRAGEPLAMYIRALMLHDGLGVPIDKDAAREFTRRAGRGLPLWRLEGLTRDATNGKDLFESGPDIEFSNQLVRRRMAEGDLSAYSDGLTNCSNEYPLTHGTLQQTKAALIQCQSCQHRWLLQAGNAGHRPAMGELAQMSLVLNGAVDEAIKWFGLAGDALSRDERFYFGLAKVLGAGELDGIKAGVSQMREALIQNPEKYRDRLDTSLMGLLSILDHVQVAALGPQGGRVMANACIALRAIAEVDNVVKDTRTAIWFNEDLRAMLVVYDSASTVRIARALAGGMKSADPASDANQVVASDAAQRRIVPVAPGGAEGSVAKADPEQQKRTGYVPGAPRSATGGQSTFTVDNGRGAGDAVARLYMDGKKPAVRSFFVKSGEQFAAKSLPPGSYVLRYRHMGSDDTYEADRSFALTQSDGPDGTQFSNVKVTLFGVKDGNLQTRRVPSDQF